jgi:hypothetical protein
MIEDSSQENNGAPAEEANRGLRGASQRPVLISSLRTRSLEGKRLLRATFSTPVMHVKVVSFSYWGRLYFFLSHIVVELVVAVSFFLELVTFSYVFFISYIIAGSILL